MRTDNIKKQKDYSQPTLEKNGELALFYNVAYNRLSDLIFNLEGSADNNPHCDEIRARFFKEEHLEDKGKGKTIKDFNTKFFKDKTYAYIKAFV